MSTPSRRCNTVNEIIESWVISSRLNQHGRVALLPFCEISLKTANPKPYPTNPQTIGEHLKKRLHELGLYQKDAAAFLQVNQWTLIGWEKGSKDPAIQFWPRIIKFLGYDPFPEPRTLGGRLLATRRRLGLSQAEMANALRLDEGTVRLIEAGRRRPSPDTLAKIERTLATHPPPWGRRYATVTGK